MHDDQQIVRLFQLDQALSHGHFPVRWVNDLGFGFGYPLFNFYPPLVYYLGEIYYLLGNTSYITAIKLVFASSFIFSAAAMYFWTRHHFGRLPAVVSAAFYTYAPYRAVDAFVRGALAEAFSFVWLPIILLSIDQLFSSKTNSPPTQKHLLIWSLVLCLSYSGLMLTHNLIVLPFTLLLPFYVLLKLGLSRRFPFKSLSFTLTAGILALTLTAFFWLPALAEKQFTLVDDILLTERYSYSLHYVHPTQLWNSIWGYGGSSPDLLDGFSLKIGKLHLLASVAAVIAAVFTFFKSKTQKISPRFQITAITFILLILSSLMTTSFTSFVWDTFTPLQFLQFPWRFLTFTTLFTSILSGALVYFLSTSFRFSPAFKISFASLLVAALLIPNAKLFTPQHYLDVDDSFYTDPEFTRWTISKTSFEFAPKGVATRIEPPLDITQIDIDQDQIPTEPYTTTDPSTRVDTNYNLTHKKRFTIETPTEITFQLNTFYFPGWQARLNGDRITINTDNPFKLIQLDVPAGTHQLNVEFSNTPVRTVGNTFSAITLAGLVFITYYFRLYQP